MGRPFKRLLTQTVVYWAPSAVDEFANTTWAGAVEYTKEVRWENKGDLFLNADGVQELSNAVVYSDSNTSIVRDSKLYLGSLADLTTAQKADADIVVNAFRVVAVKDSPGLRGRRSLKKVWLK